MLQELRMRCEKNANRRMYVRYIILPFLPCHAIAADRRDDSFYPYRTAI